MTRDRTAVCWRAEDTPHELHALLRELGLEYSILEGVGKGIQLKFEPSEPGVCIVQLTGGVATIRYSGLNLALRGIGTVLAGLVPDGTELYEETSFKTLGFMLDCSRNAVMKPEHVKLWLRRLALLGYNQAMLYTEDTYELEGEDYFGYQRGRYTAEELKDLDAYAAGLGIELVACIQTLGHLEQILRWPAYAGVTDFQSVLLVGEEKTYRLIAKMLDAVRDRFSSWRVHVGMDEAWHLGRGAYLDRFGARRRFDIFNEHLNRVCALCRDRGLEPMIWSDMYFRMGSPSGAYYDPETRIPDDVAAQIPKDVRLVYWDYYHSDPEFYKDWIARHRALGFEPVMASGVWTWARLWYDPALTEANAGACISACREAGVKELFFTLWGDDGAYCDFDSALAGLAFASEQACSREFNAKKLAARFKAVCRADYGAVRKVGELNGPVPGAAILWDDPLLGIFHQHGRNDEVRVTIDETGSWQGIAQHFAGLRDDLSSRAAGNEAGDIHHAALLADVLSRKVSLRLKLEQAYRVRDRSGLAEVRAEIPALVSRLEELAQSWRGQWLRRNKPFGLEVIQIRLAGLRARYLELGQRLDELLAGKVTAIPELGTPAPKPQGNIGTSWHDLASGSVIA
jgi:hexosaminidase